MHQNWITVTIQTQIDLIEDVCALGQELFLNSYDWEAPYFARLFPARWWLRLSVRGIDLLTISETTLTLNLNGIELSVFIYRIVVVWGVSLVLHVFVILEVMKNFVALPNQNICKFFKERVLVDRSEILLIWRPLISVTSSLYHLSLLRPEKTSFFDKVHSSFPAAVLEVLDVF